MDLSVDVGLSHVVEINQGQAPYSAACQGLHRPRAHAAYAHHHHMGSAYALCTADAVQAGQAAKATLDD
jgi:hypothetical protein